MIKLSLNVSFMEVSIKSIDFLRRPGKR